MIPRYKLFSVSGLLRTLLLAGGAAAIGYMAAKLKSDYDAQAQVRLNPGRCIVEFKCKWLNASA